MIPVIFLNDSAAPRAAGYGSHAMKKQAFRRAFRESVPILCSYLFISVAYGIMMNENGMPWFVSLLASVTVYTGAFQFVLITFLASGASLATVALTALLMSSRQLFYGITFLDEFRRMGRRKLYMIHSLTDETYAVNCSLPADLPDRQDVMFYLAALSQSYWVIGTLVGAVLGQVIPWDLEGIDFCMTALFVIIVVDQWEHTKNHLPALLGGALAVVCLIVFCQSSFMLPALLITSGILLCVRTKEGEA